MTERLFNGKPFKRTHRLTRDVPMTPLEKLGDALERCIVGCQGRRNAERAQAVLDVIREQGWRLEPPGEDRMREALEKAANQFEFYCDEHLAKWRDESLSAQVQSAAFIKSKTNYLMAKMCRAALVPPEEEK